jgi:hypothetical protein
VELDCAVLGRSPGFCCFALIMRLLIDHGSVDGRVASAVPLPCPVFGASSTFGDLCQETEVNEAFGGGEDGLFVGARSPAEYLAGSLVACLLSLAEFGEDLGDRLLEEGDQS